MAVGSCGPPRSDDGVGAQLSAQILRETGDFAFTVRVGPVGDAEYADARCLPAVCPLPVAQLVRSADELPSLNFEDLGVARQPVVTVQPC